MNGESATSGGRSMANVYGLVTLWPQGFGSYASVLTYNSAKSARANSAAEAIGLLAQEQALCPQVSVISQGFGSYVAVFGQRSARGATAASALGEFIINHHPHLWPSAA